jgi:hypothetical protein
MADIEADMEIVEFAGRRQGDDPVDVALRWNSRFSTS